MKTKLDCYLKPYRRRWDLTQKELAALLGYKTGAIISRLERSIAQPGPLNAFALELILGMPADKLFPSFFAQLKRELNVRVQQRYEELQGNSSHENRLKLDFLEEVLERTDDRPKRSVV